MGGVTSQRSNTSTRLRKAAGADIFDCKSTDLLSPSVRLKKFRDDIGWYVEEGSSGGYSSLDVPILHRDWNGKYDIKTCFLNPALMRVRVSDLLQSLARLLLNSSMSLSSADQRLPRQCCSMTVATANLMRSSASKRRKLWKIYFPSAIQNLERLQVHQYWCVYILAFLFPQIWVMDF